jgi:glycine/D-amino acid oxidase-like deaminating enzyme
MKIPVVGAGVTGLTCAVSLLEAGTATAAAHVR